MAQSSFSARRSSALSTLALLLPLAGALFWSACAGPVVPDTASGLVCASDNDCDPEDNCVSGHCLGASAGPVDAGTTAHDAGAPDSGAHDAGAPDSGAHDAGAPDSGTPDAGASDSGTPDAGAHDAGSPDAGAIDAGAADAGAPDAGAPDAGAPDAGTDAGPGQIGYLTLTPAHTDVSVAAGVAPSAVTLTAGNSGTAALHYVVQCSSGNATPGGGTINAGATVSIQVDLPVWYQTGTQSVSCYLTASDAMGSPASWTATVTVTAPPSTGPIGPGGGTVDLLNFVFTGDTRPTTCDSTATYPDAAFRTILGAIPQYAPQFGLDLGDHMFVCGGGLATAQAQMKLYTDALAAKWPSDKPWFMTMGNHECNAGGAAQVCGDNDVNWVAYQAALWSVSKQGNANYKVDIQTRLGLVRILSLADNHATPADVTQAEAWLSEGQTKAKAIFVGKHHTVAGSRTGPIWVLTLLDKYKVTGVLVAHDHKYYRSAYARSGGLGGSIPTVVCGLGAANSGNRGFCRMQQKSDGTFDMIQYDDSGNPHDTWNFSGMQ